MEHSEHIETDEFNYQTDVVVFMGPLSPVAIFLDENQTIKLYAISLDDVKHKECRYNGSTVDIPIANRSDSEGHTLFSEFKIDKPIENILMFLLDSATVFRRYGIQLGIMAIKKKYSVNRVGGERKRTHFQAGIWHYQPRSTISSDGFVDTKISCTPKI